MFFLLGIKTDLNAPDEQAAKTCTFIEVGTFAHDQLIKRISLAEPVCYLPS